MATQRLTEKYTDAPNKDALFAEIEARRKEGRDMGDITDKSQRSDMEAALDLDDASKVNPAQPPAPLPKLKASNIPVAPLPDNIPVAPGDAPKDEEYRGLYTKDDGEEYALAVNDNAHDGRTHFAKNSRHFWNGTKAEFVAQFTKK